jgi:hypothetical protein
MPSSEVSLTTNPVIDISHESLIRQWRRLRHWTQRETESRAELLRLVEAARLYARKLGDFWRGRDLERVLEWRNNEQPTVPWVSLCTGGDGASQWELAQTFLADSKQAAERERKYRQRLVWTRRSAFFAVVVVTVVAALSVAFLQGQAKSRARSSELANQALLELDQDPARSAHLALAAINHDPDNARAEYALRQSLATLEIAHVERIVSLAEPITDARFTRDGSRIVVATRNNIRVYDARSYELVRGPFAREKEVIKAWLIANNTLVTLTEDGQGQIQTVDNGRISAVA